MLRSFTAAVLLLLLTPISSESTQKGLNATTGSLHFAVPWRLAADEPPLPYEGLHGDLLKLLLQQADSERRVTLIITAGPTALLRNCLLTLLLHGQTDRYIVATTNAADLRACQRLRLPCLDAAPQYQALGGGGSLTMLTWLKVVLVDDILSLDFHVHFSDSDLVYLRPLWPSFDALMEGRNADMTFMREDVNNVAGVNTGNFFAFSNMRTRRLMRAWLSRVNAHAWEQAVFNTLRRGNGATDMDVSFAFCHSRSTCTALRHQGMAALLRHPAQAAGNCPPTRMKSPCGGRRLYLHMICIKGAAAKEARLRRLGLWMLKSPELEGPSGNSSGYEARGAVGRSGSGIKARWKEEAVCEKPAWPRDSDD